MSKISQIEAELDKIESGKFQKLCDTYLYMKYRISPKSEGSAKGTDKTKPGTPDSYMVLPNGNFVFTEYTTQKSGIGQKFLKDLKKNFNEEKTGVPIHKIESVFLCYNSQLSPAETNKIIDFCAAKNTNVEFIDLDHLKFELYQYPKLAKDFLNIETDTEQILKPDDFINELEYKGTTQTNKFIAREEELDRLTKALKNNNLIILSGKAGLGKTRLAQEAVKKYIHTHKDYEPFCIVTKGQSLYHDLKAYFLVGRKYVVIVDDANRIDDFPSITRLIRSQKFEVKLIVTVRDYAFDVVKKHLVTEKYPYTKIELEPLGDETVREILKSMKVTNPLCVNNITRIADGNPRLVIMSADYALIDDDCDKLRDITDIYDNFFEPLVSRGKLGDKNLLSVLGIICFFRVLDKNHDELIQRIYRSFGVDENDFWESVFKLHELEFVNLYEKRVVKIADQVLANYFFYLVFIKEEILDFSIILNDYLIDFNGKIKESLYPILEHFKYDNIIKIISPKLDKRLAEIKERDEQLFIFFEVFGFYQQEQILLFIKSKIEQLPDPKSTSFLFRKEKKGNWWETDKKYPLLRLLKQYGHFPNDHFETSLQLIFYHVQKSPEILPDVIEYLEGQLLFDEGDYRSGYWRQITLFEFLFKKIKKGLDNQLFIGVLFEVAAKFLKTSFERTKPGRKRHTLTMYNVGISKTSEIEKLRKAIFERVFGFTSNYFEKVLLFLESYCNTWERNTQKELYEYDSQFVIPYFQKYLSPKDFRHCQIVHDYFEKLGRLKIHLTLTSDLLKKFRNQEFDLYEILIYNRTDWYRENRKRKRTEFEAYNKKRLAKLFSHYSLEDYFRLIEDVDGFIEKSDRKNTYDITVSLNTILINVLETSPQNCWAIVKHLFNIGNPFNYCSLKIVHDSIHHFSPDEIYTTLKQNEFEAKEHWLFNFFISLKTEQVNSFYKDELLKLYSTLQGRHFLSFKFLQNYKTKEPDIYKKVFAVLLEKVGKEDFHFEFYAPDVFTEYISEFEDDFSLLKKIYFHSYLKLDFQIDQKGEYFKILYSRDNSFLFDFIKELLQDKFMFTRDELEFNFHFVWEYSNAEEVINSVINYTIETKVYSGGDHIASKFFSSTDLSDRIDIFFKNYIEEHSSDEERMKAIFSAIRICYPNQRVKYLQILLNHNSDLEFWYYLPIARGSSSGIVSSFIPFYEGQLEFWEELLPIFAGSVEYLEYRQWVQSKIKYLKNEIEREIERKFIGDY